MIVSSPLPISFVQLYNDSSCVCFTCFSFCSDDVHESYFIPSSAFSCFQYSTDVYIVAQECVCSGWIESLLFLQYTFKGMCRASFLTSSDNVLVQCPFDVTDTF